MVTINPVGPRSYCRHYSNPDCQGTLIRQTAKWPGASSSDEYEVYVLSGYQSGFPYEFHRKPKSIPQRLPADLEAGSAYLDRMQEWDCAKYTRAMQLLSNGMDSPDDELIAFVKEYFGIEVVVAVRTVFYFNASNGYPCPRVDYIFKPK